MITPEQLAQAALGRNSEVDPIVKTRKRGELRWAGLSPAGKERRDEQAKRPVLLAFGG